MKRVSLAGVATIVAAILVATVVPSASAQGYRSGAAAKPGMPANQMPQPLEGVGFDQNLGAPLPLDARFVDDHGRPVALGDYFDGRPVLLALVYYECPMLCNLVTAGVVSSLKAVKHTVGEEFDVVVVSIDPEETPAMAAQAKERAVARYARDGSAPGWHFLTGDQSEITRLADAVGFRYAYDEETDEYAHASGIVLATPDGHAGRYLFGTEYAPRDVQLGLVEASQGGIGSAVDQVMLFCYKYDPQLGRYSAAVFKLVRLGGVLTLLLLGGTIFVYLRRERRRPTESPSLGTA